MKRKRFSQASSVKKEASGTPSPAGKQPPGGSPPSALKNNEIVHGLQRISQYVRWMACNLLHDDYMSLADNKQKTFPSSTILSLL